jgi:hypothetical protein
MKYRVSETDLINLDKVDAIDIDGKIINFNIGNKTYQSFYKNEQQAMFVFNNIVNHFKLIDFRFKVEKETKFDSRKDKAFEMFWNLYDKKVDKSRCKVSFMRLSMNEMVLAVKNVSKYVKATPDKKYRKDPRSWIIAKAWLNEINNQKSNTKYIKPKYVNDER